MTEKVVIAGLDPAIPINLARPCHAKRDGRVKPGLSVAREDVRVL
jgi:hypothetical protein